jgi:hypothetical protein
MEAARAGQAIRAHVDGRTPLTVADASAKTGLALRDAESGLTWLSTEYRGQLRVTSEGELVHVFPYGFTRPWEGRDARLRLTRAVGHAITTALRFIVRAWVAVVLVGYAAIFVSIIIAMMFARQGGDSRRSDSMPGGALAYAFFRVVGDALFWTLHPWSPFSVYGYSGAGGWNGTMGRNYGARRQAGPRVPLYERVNRFFFGPQPQAVDPLETERRVVEAIRAGKGRIGLADVMRVTGLPREQADPMMARLMLDYEGDVAVSEEGGIFYRFSAIRKTASETSTAPAMPTPAWARAQPLPPLTGNSVGANLAVAAINAFNMLMGLWSIENGMTLERFAHLFDRVQHHPPLVFAPGTPIVLGVIPLVMSGLLFLLPIARAATRPWTVRRAKHERGRLAVLREVLERVRAKQPVTDEGVAEAWRKASGDAVDEKSLNRELVSLGGDVSIEPTGNTRWRFADLETEAAAVAAEREAAPDEEARLGKVIFE